MVSTSPVLAAAFSAGLVEIGWSGAQPTAASDLRAAPGPVSALVVVADEHGAVPELPARIYEAADVVVVVDCHLALMVLPAAAVVVDADQPLQGQLRAVAYALNHKDSDPAPTGDSSAEDVARIGTLTLREAQVLDALMAGMSAAEIATLLVVSLATVRAHIRALVT